MDEHNLLGSSSSGGGGGSSFLDWSSRTRSPDADQEYFIDKMRMLKIRLKKTEEENRVLYRCLAEQKTDVKEALRDKCFVINSVQYEMSELKKHILVLLNCLTEDQSLELDPNDAQDHQQQQQQAAEQLLLLNLPSTSSSSTSLVSRNKSLEENFKKELKKNKELERQVLQLTESMQIVDRDREDLQEKNAFIEEENNIQREQIQILEDTVRDLEEVAMRASVAVDEQETQTEVRGEELMAIMNENVEDIMCLVSKLSELQERNVELESKYQETRRALHALHRDFHERGKLMSELENELNALKMRERSDESVDRRMRCRRLSSNSYWEDEQYPLALNFDASVFLSPNSSSRSCSSGSSSLEFEDEEDGLELIEEQNQLESKKTEVRKFIRNLRNRRRNLHDLYRSYDGVEDQQQEQQQEQ